MRTISQLALGLGVFFLSSGLTIAAKSGSYVGFGAGVSRIDSPNQNLIGGPSDYDTKRNLGGFGGRLFTGYNFNRFLGIEFGTSKYAQSKYSSSNGDGSFDVTYNTSAVDLVGKVYLPLLGSGFNVYGLGGAARASATQKASLKGTDISSDYDVSISRTTTKFRPIYGGGISYDGSSNVSMSIEFSQILGTGKDTTMPNANMLTLNVSYNVG